LCLGDYILRIWYVKEEEKNIGFLRSLWLSVKSFFGIIKIEIVQDKIVCTLPIKSDEVLSEKKIIKFSKKLNKKLYEFDVTHVVLSDFLFSIELFKNRLCGEGINILDGKALFKFLIYDVISYIVNELETDISDLEISFLANSNNEVISKNIEIISGNIKSLNIVTNHMEKFKKLEDYLYEELGIMIKVSNNRKKALSKTNILINVDFPNELLNRYSIPDNCIIVNINGNISINSKKFNGVNVNGYKLDIGETYKMEKFNDEIMYESEIYNLMRRL
jgi:hypothetical protein